MSDMNTSLLTFIFIIKNPNISFSLCVGWVVEEFLVKEWKKALYIELESVGEL